MAKVNFTYALKRFFPALKSTEISGSTLREILTGLDHLYPGLTQYLVDDQGTLRKHVNIFIDGSLVQDRTTLQDRFSPQSEIFIMQALSGG